MPEAPLRLLHLEDDPLDRDLVNATLRQDGLDKVVKGMTTVDEILRVTENAM